MSSEECFGINDLGNVTPTLELNSTSNFTSGFTPPPSQSEWLSVAENVIYDYLVKAVCACGLLGNLLNLLVLTSQSLTRSMERLEKCAHAGLLSLAVSDMLFCLIVLMHKKPLFTYPAVDFDLLFHLYSSGLINTFMMSSTWLTVCMALSRYFVVCHPLRAREVIGGVKFTRVSIITVYLCSAAFNVPRYFTYRIETFECQGGWRVYGVFEGYMKKDPIRSQIYMWIYFVLCVLVPLLILVACNRYLIRALNQSAAMRRQYTRDQSDHSAESKALVTRTLVIIVLFYLVLVVPTEMLSFLHEMINLSSSSTGLKRVNFAIAVGNLFQATNFSFNFVLYCVINSKFRRTLRDIICCRIKWCSGKAGLKTGLSLSQANQLRSAYNSQYTRCHADDFTAV